MHTNPELADAVHLDEIASIMEGAGTTDEATITLSAKHAEILGLSSHDESLPHENRVPGFTLPCNVVREALVGMRGNRPIANQVTADVGIKK